MKKLFLILAVVGLFSLSTATVMAQEAASAPATEQAKASVNPEVDVQGTPLHQVLKQKFLEGGAVWMAPILLCFILGLAIAIERIIYLNLSGVNTKKLIAKVDAALKSGGIEAAKDVCRDVRGPVASIFYQGLMRYDEGMDVVEKSIVSYGSVQTGHMESGLSWLSLFIAVAPMLGFLGTVVGMVEAFDAIQAAGDISPTLVAGGIKVALLTTLAGLIVAIILQVFFNYILSKIADLVISMEDSSITLIDMLTKFSKK